MSPSKRRSPGSLPPKIRSQADRERQAIYRRAHYNRNRQTYIDHSTATHRREMEANPTRNCEWCGEPYPRTRYGPRKFCSVRCRKEYQRDQFLRKTYGISMQQYLDMLISQDYRCGICNRKSKFTLAVEHSHITNTVRGLCCMTCNRDVLGPIDGDVDRIQRAINYLERMRDDLARHNKTTDPMPDPLVVPGNPERPQLHLSPTARRPR